MAGALAFDISEILMSAYKDHVLYKRAFIGNNCKRRNINAIHRQIIWDDVFFGEEYHDRQFTKVFLLWADVDEKSLTLQEEEVSAVKWMDLDECIEGVKANAFKHCIYPEELLMVKKRALA